MNPKENKYLRFRVVTIGIFFGLFLGAICAKAAYLQIYRGSWLSQLAADQYEASVKTSGKRGTIYDRKMSELAVSIQVTSIAAYPARLDDPAKTAAALAKPLNLDRSSLQRSFRSKKTFVWVKRQATPREVEKVKELNLGGIGFVPEYNRFYPKKTLAAQVIGFTGVDGAGLEGLEHFYDRSLKGAETEYTYLRDALGNRFVSNGANVPDFSGKNLILTIDQTVQFIAERTLEDTVTEFDADSGIAIVMEPKSGALLAIAQYPFFNPNAYREFKSANWRNRAITDAIEPGSTLKIFSATAAIEFGDSSPNTIFFCENGAYRIGRKVVRDVSAHGWLSLQQIVKYSSNIGAIKISEIVGAKHLFNTLVNFGFGAKTGIDCPGESPGSLSNYRQWTRMDTSAISFGHGMAASPLQLVTAVSAIANKGVLMKPYFVAAVTDQSNQTLQSFAPHVVRRVVSESTARKVATILKTVVAEGGTGTQAALQGFSVGGKTGTAKKIGPDGTYSDDDYIASFVGFTPVDNPAITVLVIINEPRKQYYGGVVAAPAFRRIAQETLNYLNVHPDIQDGQLAAAEGTEGRI
ncbi:MAG: penicillin-binding protein 2 [Desulfobacterales bacterium]|nr:penicillin-binding protein 2 [Desulfobacterales bacterium]